jgi:hypothetical protein
MTDKIVLHSWWLEQVANHKSKATEAFFISILNEISIKDIIASWKRYYFDGFDTFSDYEKYGDMFIPIKRRDNLK